MGWVTYLQVGEALKDTFAAHASLTHVLDADELRENIDEPTLQIYPESGAVDVATGTDRTTFGTATHTPRRQAEQVWHLDLYACQRRHIGQDFGKLLPLMDAVEEILSAQDDKPFFGLLDGDGLNAIQAFSWQWQRVAFIYGDAGTPYAGARYTLTLRFF
jgi:hypothetical protein